MDEFIYSSFERYFGILSKFGYMNFAEVKKLLLLNFYYNLIFRDYRGYVEKEDYEAIMQALNCLYGTNCLIPYPDYLKMRKLHLGEMTELATRVQTLEDTSVLKAMDADGTMDSDIMIVAEEETA